ncbi:glycosyltransferase [uncultured Lutibacter sp.]|uniref:glycosyltransferase family 2 protein n=1 Tax=uncultured Lutibacter sp. TaxID=437739 RepID=UPI00263985BE|nr:glycosyltransferase [uncultured Lutibacter sp.]
MDSLVSIIVPCYNQAHFLEEALQSVLNQTYKNWECIIVNDGSTDNTDEIAKKWLLKDNRFKYINKKNGGLSSARNAGLKLAIGHYIQFLDSDDLLEKEKIKVQLIELLNDNEIDISVSGYRYFDDNCEKLKIMGKNNFFPEVILSKDDTDIIEVLKIKNPMVISAPIYRKFIFEKVGVFDEDLISLEDWDFHTRCVLHKIKFQHIGNYKETRTLIRLHANSMMRNKEVMNKAFQLFVKKRNENKLFIQRFSIEKQLDKENKHTKFKRTIKLFIPPICFKLYKNIKR